MTRASDTHPVVRVVRDADGREYVLELCARHCRLRPIRTRRGGPAEVTRTWAQIFLDGHHGSSLASNPRLPSRRRSRRR